VAQAFELGAFTGLDLQAGVKGEPACVSLSDGLPQSPPSQDLRPYGTRQLDADAALSAATASPGYPGKAERVILFHLEAFDWNCPQHITPRFSEAEMVQALEPVRIRIEQLEAENARLRERLGEAPPRSGPASILQIIWVLCCRCFVKLERQPTSPRI